MLVYKITNLLDGKLYIGVTSNMDRRMMEHRKLANLKAGYALHRAMHKHGLESFKEEILMECMDESEAYVFERYFIELVQSRQPNGYNLTDGGDSPPSQAGKIQTPENIAKRLIARQGYRHSEATKLKQSIAAKRRPINPEAAMNSAAKRRGKTLCELHGPERAKLIIAQRSESLKQTHAHRKAQRDVNP